MFDDGLLDDEAALARADLRLRTLAESGARVRREAVAAEDAIRAAVGSLGETRPRAVVAAGPASRSTISTVSRFSCRTAPGSTCGLPTPSRSFGSTSRARTTRRCQRYATTSSPSSAERINDH
jgi:hypothetical protein